MTGAEAKLRDLSAREEQRRLSKADLLRPRIVQKTEFIESLGGEVVLQSLSHAARQELRERAKVGTPEFDEDLFSMLVIVHSLVEPKLEEEDIKTLREQDATILDDISMRITMLNMMGRGEELGEG